MSHELRTPLNAILGNVELLLDGSIGPLGAEARRCIAEIQIASHALLRQSQMLLLLIQVLEAAGPGDESAFPLEQLFGDAWRDGRRGMRVESDEAARRHHLAGDPVWLRTLARLVAEAGEPDRGPVLRIALRDGPVIDLTWQDLEVAELPSLTVVLIDAIARLHGGRLVSADGPHLLLSLPGRRIRVFSS